MLFIAISYTEFLIKSFALFNCYFLITKNVNLMLLGGN